jgi:oligogalacturonide lyase
MRVWPVVALLLTGGSALNPQGALLKDWTDAETGHRVVRLTDDAGGSTLYFHDNAFSPQGDKLMVSTPNGIASVDVATIGTGGSRLEIVTARARGGYFARRTREIYYNGSGRGSGTVTAFNIDTRQTRDVPHAAASSTPTKPSRSSRTARPSIRMDSIHVRQLARFFRSCCGCFPAGP